MSTKAFASGKYQQFQDVCSTAHAMSKGVNSALKAAGYKLSHQGASTTATKGRAAITFGLSPKEAVVTIIHSKNMRHV